MSTVALYKNFLNEDIDVDEPLVGSKKEKPEPKKLKLYISPSLEILFTKMMKTSDFQVKTVANRILNIDKAPEEENLFPISYIDIDKEKEDSVTFLPANRAYFATGYKSPEDFKKPSPDSELWNIKGRQSLGVGKFINKLFDDFSDIAIDKFVNVFKAEVAATMVYNKFKLITGEEIRHWYAGSNYYTDPQSGGGYLGNSCMRYDGKISRENCQPYFDIYCKNPEKCALLILPNSQGKLMGRAIIWSHLRKPTERTFMDRVYTVRQSDVELFKKYATEQGWIYKLKQEAHDSTYIDNGKTIDKSISVQLKPLTFDTYPYMDTLKFYTPGTGRLASDQGNPAEGFKRLRLENGGGTFQRVD
jgi:hypothetical protein